MHITALLYSISPIVAVFLICAAGCLKHNPRSDFERTAHLVADRTGAEQSYDANPDQIIDSKIGELLEGGLTVEKAVRIALLNNPEFQAAFQQIGAGRADVVQSQLLSNPSLGITILFPSGGGQPKIPLSIGQDIVDLWQIPVRRKIAESELEQLVLSVAHRGVDIATQTRAACYRLISLQNAEDLAVRNVKRLERVQREAPAPDSARVGMEALDAQLVVTTVRRDRRVARASLARILGLGRRWEGWTLTDTLPKPDALVVPESRLIDYALTERLDARAMTMHVAAAEHRLERQQLNLFPRVAVGFAGEQKDTRGVPGRNVLADTVRTSIARNSLTAPNIQSKGQHELARRYIIDYLLGPRLDVTLPIWDQNQAQIAKARFALEEQRRQQIALLNALTQDVQQAYAELEAAAEQVALYDQKILPQAVANADAEERAYLAGKQPSRAFLDANRWLTTRRLAYMTVLREYALALAALQRAGGGRIPPMITTQPALTQPG